MKRNMKKIASVLLVAMLALCLTACGGGKDNGGAVEIADATKVLTYYAYVGASMDPQWDSIIPSLKELVGSLWYDRANAAV